MARQIMIRRKPLPFFWPRGNYEFFGPEGIVNFFYCVLAEDAEKHFNSKRDKLRKDFEDKLVLLEGEQKKVQSYHCLLYTSPSPRDS